MFEFDPVLCSIIVFLSALIPGLLIVMPFLKKSQFTLTEKLLCSFFIGLFIVPTILFLEMLIGIDFSYGLTLMDLAAVGLIGIAIWSWKFHKHEIQLPQMTFTWQQLVIPVCLIVTLILAFWIRIQPYSPVYSELDPYWYVYGTGQILQQGMVPAYDHTAWWPEMDSDHRGEPLKMYLEAQWYTLYTSGQGTYNNLLLFTMVSWEPCIAAAMVCFGAYFLVSSLYQKKYGLLVAFLLACTPVTIYKFSGGVNDVAPLSMGLLVLSIGMLAYSISKKDKTMYALTAFYFFATISGTSYIMVLLLIFSAFLVLQSLDYFLRGKENPEFMELISYAFAGSMISGILQIIYLQSLNIMSFLESPFGLVLACYIFALFCYFLPKRMNLDGKRLKVLAIIIIVALAAYLLTPVGKIVKSQIDSYVGTADFKSPLEKTIAEQNIAGSSFEGIAGFLAYIPAAHTGDALYFIYSPLASIFTLMGNLMLHTMDIVLGFASGMTQATVTMTDSLLFVWIVLALVGLAMRHFAREGDEREIPSIMILIIAALLPVMYVGLNKMKFTVFVGVAAAIFAGIAIAECELFIMWIMSKRKSANVEYTYTKGRYGQSIRHTKEETPNRFDLQGYAKYIPQIFICLMIAIAYMEYSGLAGVLLIKSFTPRYQDNPVANAPIAANLCSQLEAKGVPANQIQTLCDAGSSPLAFANTTAGQFDPTVCWMSQMTVGELMPANDTASQMASAEAVASAQFRCQALASYWITSMDWIHANLNSTDTVMSWWDYGHWLNFFGNVNAVLRNEQASQKMIGNVAYDYLDATPQQLASDMNHYNSRYVLFDSEIIGGTGGSGFGNKYGALNYLACAYANETTLEQNPGQSQCEFDHNPENFVVPSVDMQQHCIISQTQQISGVEAFPMTLTGPSSTPKYCMGGATLSDGEKVTAVYYLNETDSDGNLILNTGFVRQTQAGQGGTLYELAYDNSPAWMVNGTATGGYGDAPSGFYTSNLYRAFFLERLPGFTLVYNSDNVKIYRLDNFTGNVVPGPGVR